MHEITGKSTVLTQQPSRGKPDRHVKILPDTGKPYNLKP